MYRFTTFLLLTFLVSSIASATEALSTDGAWWNGLSTLERAEVMLASTSAYSYGFNHGQVDQFFAATSAIIDSKSLTASQSGGLIAKIKSHTHDPTFSAKVIGSYVDSVSNFYSSHPQAMRMEVGELFACVQDAPTISCDALAQLYARQHSR